MISAHALAQRLDRLEQRPMLHDTRLPPVTAADLMRSVGMEPDPWQREVFESTAKQQLWLAHRQSGKSTSVAAIAWEQAHNVPNSLTLLVSRTLRQSVELFRKVKTFHQASEFKIPLIRDTVLSLETAHHSRIISLPAHPDTVVGYSAPDLVIIDEASRVADDLYFVLRPMFAMSRGRLIALSTPWGRRGWFHDAWQGGAMDDDLHLDTAQVQAILADLGVTVTEDDVMHDVDTNFAWHRVRMAAPDNPRLSKRFLAHERQSVPDLVFRSEWLIEFTDPEGSVFAYADIQAMLSDSVRPLFTTEAPRPVPLTPERVLAPGKKPLFAGGRA